MQSNGAQSVQRSCCTRLSPAPLFVAGRPPLLASSVPSGWVHLVSVAHLDLSLPLRRAAEAEHQRLGVALAQIGKRKGELKAELHQLEDQEARLKHRRQLLEQIMDPEAGGVLDEAPGVVLRGSRLRLEAARVLMRELGPNHLTHYRSWYQDFIRAGFLILGKRPESTFLTAVRRSPLVARGDEPGTYYIEAARVDELSQQLSEVHAELADLDDVLAKDPNPTPALRQHRARLLRAHRRLQASIDEAEAVLAVEDHRTSGLDLGRSQTNDNERAAS